MIRDWAHRAGIVRILNSGADSAYVQARGPRWLAKRLARRAVRRSSYIALDWLSIRVTKTEQAGRWSWRFKVAFRRLGQ